MFGMLEGHVFIQLQYIIGRNIMGSRWFYPTMNIIFFFYATFVGNQLTLSVRVGVNFQIEFHQIEYPRID